MLDLLNYTITQFFFDRTQELQFMGYTSRITTVKTLDLHTKKLKYFSSVKFDEQNNKFGKGWSPDSALNNGTNIYALTTQKNDISDHPFIKDEIF